MRKGSFDGLLENHLQNALRCSTYGDVVTVTLSPLKQTVEVQGTGTGIHPENLPHIFGLHFKSTRERGTAAGRAGSDLPSHGESSNFYFTPPPASTSPLAPDP
jgi:signal transduction histidine kinase